MSRQTLRIFMGCQYGADGYNYNVTPKAYIFLELSGQSGTIPMVEGGLLDAPPGRHGLFWKVFRKTHPDIHRPGAHTPESKRNSIC